MSHPDPHPEPEDRVEAFLREIRSQPPLPPGLIPTIEAARLLNVTPRGLFTFLDSGVLEGRRVGRRIAVVEASVDALAHAARAAPHDPPADGGRDLRPLWYDIGMTPERRPKEKIAVSLPAELVDAARQAVADGHATSVSALVATALREKLDRRTLGALLAELDATDGPPNKEDQAWARAALAP